MAVNQTAIKKITTHEEIGKTQDLRAHKGSVEIHGQDFSITVLFAKVSRFYRHYNALSDSNRLVALHYRAS
jgi:hypothetical protein